MSDFCIFILSYKRYDRIYTLKALLDSNYTGDLYIVVGDDDPYIEEYIKRYENIIIIKKDHAMDITDSCDNFNKKNAVVYARNICFELAKNMGYKYFLELDDDYYNFRYRYEKDGKLLSLKIKEFDKIVEYMINFLKTTNSLSVAFAQSGDFIGGSDSSMYKSVIKRKAMNSFFCDTKKPFKFVGTMNEDVNTYCSLGKTGNLFFTIRDICLDQKQTQNNPGGLTDIYIENGTYLKSFYSVITNPSCVKINWMPSKNGRIHHVINWNKCVPKIVSSDYKK